MTAAEITKLADLESREVLLAKLAGAMNASLTKAVYLFAAPLTQSARLIEALRAKVEAEGSGRAAPAATEADAAAEAAPAAAETAPPDAAAPADEPPTSPRVATPPDPTARLIQTRHSGKNRKERHHGEAQHRRAP